MPHTPAHADCIYRIDADDRFTFVAGAWNEFAADNQSSPPAPSTLLGRPLWPHIADEPTRDIYRTLLERVRDGKGPISVPFRCDAPNRRRFMSLSLNAWPGEVEFQSRLVRDETRPPVILLDSTVPRTGELVRICSWCKKGLAPGNDWVELEDLVSSLGLFEGRPMPEITHGMCPTCFEGMHERIAALAG